MDFELTEEQDFIRSTVRDFARRRSRRGPPRSTATGEFPHDIFGKMAGLGLLGLPLPEEYGGAGADATSA